MPEDFAQSGNISPGTSGGLGGKVAIVTGSTSGIGLGIAQALASNGADIVLSGLGKSDLIPEILDDISARNRVRAIYLSADVSKLADVRRMTDEAFAAFGRVDILVNNTGTFTTCAIEALSPESWNAAMSVNLTAAFLAVRTVLPGMRERGWGRIINVASALGLVGAPDASCYAASKHGLIGLTRSVALEVAGDGVTVNAICPGYVRPSLIEHEIDAAVHVGSQSANDIVRGLLDGTQPTARFVETHEIGALAAFLCSDSAASITGAAIPIDGGWTAR